MKFTDIWGKIARPIKIWDRFKMKNLLEASQALAEPINDPRKGFIYVSTGLNRKERRTLEAQLRRGAVTPVGRAHAGGHKFRAERRPLSAVGRKIAKFQLKNTPINVPARAGWLRENARRLRAGQPILIFAGTGVIGDQI